MRWCLKNERERLDTLLLTVLTSLFKCFWRSFFFLFCFFVLFCLVALSMVASLDGFCPSGLPVLWQNKYCCCCCLINIQDYASLKFWHTTGHVTFWISLSLRPKTETKPLNFGLSPEFKLTNHARRTSLRNVITDVIADISVFLCL